MRNGDGAYIQAYNAQAVVDEAHQIITAADVTGAVGDIRGGDDLVGLIDDGLGVVGLDERSVAVLHDP